MNDSNTISSQHFKDVFRESGLTSLAVMALPSQGFAADGLDAMLADGVGDMEYMKRHRRLRLHPAEFLPEARSIVCATLNYDPDIEPEGTFGIRRARYAKGKDYHTIFKKLLKRCAFQLSNNHRFRIAVDSAPLLERTLAICAGLGWLGKNALLLIPKKGSYHFLGFLFTSLELEPFSPDNSKDRCGTCSNCINACPTSAIGKSRRILSERCISYLTIEHKGVIPRKLAKQFNGWWFGCDICQEVCPWNRFSPGPGDKRLSGHDEEEILLSLSADNYDTYFAGRAIRRITYDQFRRNLMVALFSLEEFEAAKQIANKTPLELVQRQARELDLD